MFDHLAHQLRRVRPDDLYERCGFLFSKRYGNPLSFREVANTHPEPADHFRIAQADYDRAMQTFTLGAQMGVVGVLHTHPGWDRESWYPSADDLAGAAKWPALIHMVYHPYTRRLVWYQASGLRDVFHLKPRWVYKKGI